VVTDTWRWLLFADLGREKLALLVLCTIILYVVASNLAWRLGRPGSEGKFIVRVGRSWIGRGLGQGLRLLYYAGIPAAVLWRGALVREMGIRTTYVGTWDGAAVLQLLGVVTAQDMADLARGLAVIAGAAVVLILLWTWYSREISARQDPHAAFPIQEVPWWLVLREALFAQLLWALYRGCVVQWTSRGIYVAFVSLALITLPWLLNPQRRQGLYTTDRAHVVVRDWMCALFTAFASLIIPSLWVLVLGHVLWIWTSGRTLAHFAQVPLRMTLSRE
jgi:hypothetical protein